MLCRRQDKTSREINYVSEVMQYKVKLLRESPVYATSAIISIYYSLVLCGYVTM